MNLLRITAVVQDVFAVATGILQRIGQNRHCAEIARLVHQGGQRQRSVSPPGRREKHRAEGIAEDVVNECNLDRVFCLACWPEHNSLITARLPGRFLGTHPKALGSMACCVSRCSNRIDLGRRLAGVACARKGRNFPNSPNVFARRCHFRQGRVSISEGFGQCDIRVHLKPPTLFRCFPDSPRTDASK